MPLAEAVLAPLRDEPPQRVEDLNARELRVEVRVGHEDEPVLPHRDALRPHELPVARALAPPGGQVHARRGEALHPVVACVGHVHAAVRADRDRLGPLELPVARALGAPPREERAVGAELLDAVVVGVRDPDVAVGGDRDVGRPVELAVVRTLRAPAAQVPAVEGEPLHAVVRGVGDVEHPAQGVDGEALRAPELARAGAR